MIFSSIIYILCALLVLGQVSSSSRDYGMLFDPTGHLRQLEYAFKAVERNAGPICCVKLNDGLVLATSRRRPQSKLVVAGPRSVIILHNRIIVGVTGLMHDGSKILKLVSKKANEYFLQYRQPIPLEMLADFVAEEMHKNILISRRPLGLQVILAGMSNMLDKSRIYSIGPDGSLSTWKAIAHGKGYPHVRRTLEVLSRQRSTPLNGDDKDGINMPINEFLHHLRGEGLLGKSFTGSTSEVEDLLEEENEAHEIQDRSEGKVQEANKSLLDMEVGNH